MAIDLGRAGRGALAGALAAGVWAAQEPLDQRLFGVRSSDVELLGKLVTRRRWRTVGLGLHLLNGAAFGAVYAVRFAELPVPAWARGPAAALGEHLATWPLTAVADRVHPARGELPAVAADPMAFLQATWRHLLFGAVLGEAERRLNGPGDDDGPPYAHVVSSNGHGNIEHAMPGAAG
jgi:hypothetical protein